MTSWFANAPHYVVRCDAGLVRASSIRLMRSGLDRNLQRLDSCEALRYARMAVLASCSGSPMRYLGRSTIGASVLSQPQASPVLCLTAPSRFNDIAVAEPVGLVRPPAGFLGFLLFDFRFLFGPVQLESVESSIASWCATMHDRLEMLGYL
jgi:hypothetical protein